MSDNYEPVTLEVSKEVAKPEKKKAANKIKMVEDWLSGYAEFRMNLVSGKPQIKRNSDEWEDMNDDILSSLWRNMQHDGYNATKTYIDDVVRSDFAERVNPIKDYLEGLEWNHEDAISELASTLKITNYDQQRWLFFFKKYMVGMVSNVLTDKKCTNHLCLILAGGQGKGKTTWLSNLLPKELSSYYYEGKIDPENKDSLFLTVSNMLMNIDDYFDNVNKTKADNLKGFITENFVKCRKPYGRYEVTLPKRGSFAGTSNANEFLYDSSGSRRFLSVMITDILQDKSNAIDRGQVFAQAYHYYKESLKGNYVYWLTPDEQKEMESVNDQFQVESMEQELACKYLRHPKNEADPQISYYTNTDLLIKLNAYTTRNLSSNKLGKALRKLGYKKGKFDSTQRGQRVYRVVWVGEGDVLNKDTSKPSLKSDDNDDSPF